eukprot:scaffold57263_cov18-Tisochrysis_lutea.AAC.1
MSSLPQGRGVNDHAAKSSSASIQATCTQQVSMQASNFAKKAPSFTVHYSKLAGHQGGQSAPAKPHAPKKLLCKP